MATIDYDILNNIELKNPTKTLFKQIGSDRFTHYRRWILNSPMEYAPDDVALQRRDKYQFNLSTKQHPKMHCISNLCVQINIYTPYSLQCAFDHILLIKLFDKQVNLLNINGNTLYKLLKNNL